MAGNQIIYSIDLLRIIVEIGNMMFKFDACVLENPAHDLLLGTNFLAKYGVIIDIGRQQLYISSKKNACIVPLEVFRKKSIKRRDKMKNTSICLVEKVNIELNTEVWLKWLPDIWADFKII